MSRRKRKIPLPIATQVATQLVAEGDVQSARERIKYATSGVVVIEVNKSKRKLLR